MNRIYLQNTVTKEEVRHILAYDPFQPLARSTIDQMIASGELKEPSKRGRYRVWTKDYIAQYAEIEVNQLNEILKAVQQEKKAG